MIKLNKQYYNKLKSNINSFLNKENHANASRDDVANYLQRKHFINGDVSSNQEFIKLLNSKVAVNRSGLEPDSAEKAIAYMLSTIRMDKKYYEKRITRDDIMGDLRNAGKLPTKRSGDFNDILKAVIMRHNVDYTRA